MDALAGPVWVAAVLLLGSGITKLKAPAATVRALRKAELPSATILARLLGGCELAVAAAVLVSGSRWSSGLLALTYVGFIAFLLRLRRVAGARASCGCLGAGESPVTGVHVALDLLAASAALVTVAAPLGPAVPLLSQLPWSGIPALALVVLAAGLARSLFTSLPPLMIAAGGTQQTGERTP